MKNSESMVLEKALEFVVERLVEEHLDDILTDFDELGFVPSTCVPHAEVIANNWKNRLLCSIRGLCKDIIIDLL